MPCGCPYVDEYCECGKLIETLTAQRDAAMALLRVLTDGWYCDEGGECYDCTRGPKGEHEPSCVQLQARAFLADHNKASGGGSVGT